MLGLRICNPPADEKLPVHASQSRAASSVAGKLYLRLEDVEHTAVHYTVLHTMYSMLSVRQFMCIPILP